MRRCGSCGTTTDAAVAFCPTCGAYLPESPAEAPASPPPFAPPQAGYSPGGQRVGPCRRCGARVEPGALVCPQCGAERGAAPAQAAGERASNTAATLGGVVTTIAALVVLPAAGSRVQYGEFILQIAAFAVFGLLIAGLVLVSNPRASARRAFGFAMLMTLLGLFVLGGVVMAGILAICSLALSHGH